MMFDISKITIPPHSGIYMMKDASGKIIYIGKAKNLRNRVRTHFSRNQNYKTQKLIQKIHEIEFILTDNESEAFLLEANMIKQYRPVFNIELKDQQRYTYLRITNEKYPRLLVARRTRTGQFLGDGKVYGPFTYGSSKMLSIGLLRKTFKIRICKKLPKEACLEYHLGNCEAPCQFEIAKQRYGNHITEIKSILEGKKKLESFCQQLEKEMKESSANQQYEKSKEIYDTLVRLKNLQTKQKMEFIKNYDEEYFGIKIKNHTAFIMGFKITKGVIQDRNRFSFELIADNTFSSFLSQYYSTRTIPRYIIVNEIPEKQIILETIFSKNAGFAVSIIVPHSGKRKEMIDLIMKNIDLAHTNEDESSLMELKKRLLLPNIPNTIECFDVSNHGTDFAVGSMSKFIGGVPEKSGYKRFKIKSVKGRNDYAMIREIILRRYLRLQKENSALPDLILIDGGRGHLNAALDALKNISVMVPCVSIAKENEEIYTSNSKEPCNISKDNAGLKILQYARDEAHRFGLSYNRMLRNLN